jgi:hypothetical protein
VLLVLCTSLCAQAATTVNDDNDYVGFTSSNTQWGTVLTTWTVPPNPAVNDGQFIALWPGINGSQSVLQPVLSWNGSWSISSWNCCIGSPYNSNAVSVNVGDAILGVMTPQCALGTQNCQNWTVTTVDVTSGQSTTLNSSIQGQSETFLTPAFLETQYLTGCQDLPASTAITFTTYAFDNNLNQITPSWMGGADANNGAGSSIIPLPCGWTQSFTETTFTLGYDSGSSSVPNFLLGGSAATLALAQGGSGSVTVSLSSQFGFSGSATLGTYGLPAGVTAAYSANPIAATSVVTFTASATAQTGTVPIAITGASGNLNAALPLLLTVNASSLSTFGVSASPSSLSLSQGASGTATVTVASAGGFSSATALSVSGLPTGVTAAFSPGSVTPPANGSAAAVLTLTASAAATTGASTLTITATSGSVSHTTALTLQVDASSAKLANGTYTVTNASSGLLWTDHAASPNRNIVLKSASGATTQKWQFTQLADGSYEITNVSSGQSLNDPGSSQSTVNLIEYPYYGTGNDQWWLTRSGNGYTLTSEASAGLVVDPHADTSGAYLRQAPASGSTAQVWVIQ